MTQRHSASRRQSRRAPTTVCAEVIAYGQGGLSFKRVLESPDQYLKEIGHPDLLVIDLGSNDLTCVYSTVAEVADDALRFLALVDNDVRPKMIVLLSVIERTSVSDRGGMTMSTSTFNLRPTVGHPIKLC